MANFIYKAVDPSTQKHVSVNISAASQLEANRLILERGLRPLSVKEARSGDSSLMAVLRGIKRKDRVLFTTQMSTLLSAGLPLMQSLETSADQTANKELKKIIKDVIVSIESGISFSDALAKYPRVFDSIFINLVRAGEASGALDTSLLRLAVQQEKDGALIDKLKNALVYPIIVSVVMVMVVTFMLVFVLPKVTAFYDGLEGVTLPFITQALLALSDFVINRWYFLIGIVFGAAFGLRYWMKSNTGQSVMDQMKLQTPVLKTLYRNVYMARFSRTIGTLFGAGVNLMHSLDIIQKGINNIHVERSLARSTAQVQEGTPLSVSLRQNPHFADLVSDMIQIGEQSGKTEEMLLKAANYYENEVEKALKTLSALLEPIMILTLGGVAITIILAILLPIYSVFNNSSDVF